MPRTPRLSPAPNCPNCGRPGRYVWKPEMLRDAYACMTSSCPLGEYQRYRVHGCEAAALDDR